MSSDTGTESQFNLELAFSLRILRLQAAQVRGPGIQWGTEVPNNSVPTSHRSAGLLGGAFRSRSGNKDN